jgi:EpsI family protein
MTQGRNPITSRRAFISGGLFAATAGAAYAVQPRRSEGRLKDVKLGSLIPASFAGWQVAGSNGVVVARPEDGAPADGYDQVVARTYIGAGLPTVMLMLAYGSTQGGSLQLHRPETCYPGQGFVLRAFDEPEFRFDKREVAARRFTATRDDRVERVVYWTRIANRFPLSTAQMYSVILTSALRGVVPDGMLVRASIVGGSDAATDRDLSHFLSALVSATSMAGRQVLLGSQSA